MQTVEHENHPQDSHHQAHRGRHHHGRHHHSKHHHHSHHRYDHHEHEAYEDDAALYEYYGELEPKKGITLLIELLTALKNNGEVKLADHQIAITDDIGFSITHEETWDETEKLTLAIEWSPETDETDTLPEDQEVPVIS